MAKADKFRHHILKQARRNPKFRRALIKKLANARTPRAELVKIFDSLRPGDHLELEASSVMGGPISGIFQVGRRSVSKKYRTVSINLIPTKGPIPKHRMNKFWLRKTEGYDGQPSVGFSHGDLALFNLRLKKV